MSTQLAFPFADVPITCPIQRRYHAIAPLLAGYSSIAEQAQALSIGHSTVSRWLRDFRERGMPGLFPAHEYARDPYTPERVIVVRVYFNCCAPKASARELARVVGATTTHNPASTDGPVALRAVFLHFAPDYLAEHSTSLLAFESPLQESARILLARGAGGGRQSSLGGVYGQQ